jgi:hypothetical protein
MRTEELIAALAADARPVRRLPAPSARVATWMAISVPWLAIAVLMMTLRPDLSAKLGEQRWLIEQGAALATALAAAMAAFCAGVPGRPSWERYMPLAPLVLWLGVVGEGCLSTWLHLGAQGVELRPDWGCFPSIVLVGAVPGAAMAVMLRKGAPLAPVTSVALGALASAALADFGLRLFHQEDASLMVLVWQLGSVAFIVLVGTIAGHSLLRWRHAQPV